MAIIKSLFVIFAFALVASVLGDPKTVSSATATELPSSVDPATKPSATTAAAPTTAAPPTTSAAPTTTAGPSTTTAAPPTTTAAPSTSTAAPSTTTAAPSTTSAPVTTPAPVPADKRGNWTVTEGNVTCILAQMIVSAKIAYPLQTPNKTGNAELEVPAAAKANGSCDLSAQSLTIMWGTNNLKMAFEKNDTTKLYYISQMALSIVVDDKTFPNISSDLVNKTITLESTSHLFSTSLNQSYRCIREESLPLSKIADTASNSDLKAVLVLNKVQLQAYHEEKSAVFATAQDCELDTPDVVPIAVGCALAALVLVVLVAYLVGRRRSRALGYLSM